MGAWGPASFDNDDAASWLDDLPDHADLTVLSQALTAVAAVDEVEAPEASMALAAAELVAALGGQPAPDLPEAARRWAADQQEQPAQVLRDLALSAVSRVQTRSELQELWDETPDGPRWQAVVANLAARLQGAATPRPARRRQAGKPAASRRVRVREGDLVWVPVVEGQFAVGIVLHVSRYFRQSMLVGFFPALFARPEEVDVGALAEPFVETPNYVSTLAVRDGGWSVIGHSQELLARSTVPVLRVVATLYYKDDVVGQVAPAEYPNHPMVLGQGDKAVEGKLRDHLAPSR